MPDIALRIHWIHNRVGHRTNAPGTCLWCGRKLRKSQIHPEEKGSYGDNAFCGLRCGYSFGVCLAKAHYRLIKWQTLPSAFGETKQKEGENKNAMPPL